MTYRNTRRIYIIYIIVLALLAIYIVQPCHSSPALNRENNRVLWKRVVEDYERIAALGKKGIKVRDLVDDLRIAILYLEKGETSKAEEQLSIVEDKISSLEEISDRIVLFNEIYKYSAVALLASIPVLFYFLFPRFYLYLWFKLRERWVVKQ